MPHVVITWGGRRLLHPVKMADAAAPVNFRDVTTGITVGENRVKIFCFWLRENLKLTCRRNPLEVLCCSPKPQFGCLKPRSLGIRTVRIL